MKVFAALMSAPLASAAGTLKSDLQDMLNNIGKPVQFGWKSATESFTLAAGNVTNPGESIRDVTIDDIFNYGSGTKTPVAVAIMRLVDAGKIKLSDKASTYVNPFLKRNNGTTLEELYGSQIANATVLHLLRMEAGLPDFEDARGQAAIDDAAKYSHGEVFSPYDWMHAAALFDAVCNPGNCSFYASNSYEVAGLVLAAVQQPSGDWTDLDFAKAISDDSSRYPSMQMPADQGRLQDYITVAGVSGYSGSNVTYIWEQNPTVMGWTCGGMNANTGDLARFFYDLLSPKTKHPLVSDGLVKEMKNLKQLNTGNFQVDYGAGLMDSAPPQYNKPTTKGPDDWGYIIGHIGETFAFHAISGYMPKAEAAISIVTNSDAGHHAVDAIACKASEIAAKYSGETVDLQCDKAPDTG